MRRISNEVEMPDRRRKAEFKAMTDEEIASLESIVREEFDMEGWAIGPEPDPLL